MSKPLPVSELLKDYATGEKGRTQMMPLSESAIMTFLPGVKTPNAKRQNSGDAMMDQENLCVLGNCVEQAS